MRSRSSDSRSLPESPEERVASGAAWEEFCDALKSAGRTILADGASDDVIKFFGTLNELFFPEKYDSLEENGRA